MTADIGGEFVIRELQLRDLKAVGKIEKRSFPDPWPLFWFREAMAHGAVCWAGWLGKKLIAYLIAAPEEQAMHLVNLAVNRPYLRRGFGRLMLRRLSQKAIADGLNNITLEVRRSNQTAIQFYVAEGFKQVGEAKGYYKQVEDALIFKRRL